MGLAAGQARLLTITGRKSDCEFESMRLSHQKIALARELADLSNQYQDSLDYTKLVYDYYGTGDTTTQFSYGICMTPSILNDYMPITLTDSMNRVVLDSKYAAAAKAAGIPQEGLGTLPSETVRNMFVTELCNNSIISPYLRDKILKIPYNQGIGLGGGPTVATITQDMTLGELAEYISENYGSVNFDSASGGTNSEHVKEYNIEINNNGSRLKNDYDQAFWRYDRTGKNPALVNSGDTVPTFGNIIKDYLENGRSYYLIVDGQDDHNNVTGANGIVDQICNCYIWEQMYDTFGELFDVGDTYTQRALEYARIEIEKLITNPSVDYPENYNNFSVGTDDAGVTQNPAEYNGMNDIGMVVGYCRGRDDYDSWVGERISDMYGNIGINVVINNDDDGKNDNDSCMSAGSINISAMIMAYLTYFADFINGVSKTDAYGFDLYNVKEQEVTSRLVDEDFVFRVKTGEEVSSDDLGQAQFYDALFNQLCLNGWTENDNVKDNDYLQKMLENGMMYMTKMKDDGYYYQGNYATDSYVKVVADERRIAAAEAKYNTEKAKLNAKEQTLDMKMKNLDTEISSLTTEYDTIKNTLSKNIERGFKRYSA